MRALVLLTLALGFAGTDSAGAQSPQHPLDGLSLAEHWVVYDVIRDSGRTDGKTRYAGVALREPPKAEVLAWKHGAPFRREARAILMLGPKTVEAIVDVSARKLASWKEVPGAQPDMTAEEFEAQDEIAKKSPEVIAALKRRGITDLATVACDGSTGGYYAIKEDEGRRLALTSCVDEHGVENSWGREIAGLVIYIDLHERKVFRVVDTGVVPLAKGAVDYNAEAIGPARDPLPPLRIEQPMGPGFKRDGNEVSWDRWRFHVRVEARGGAVISDVRYVDGPRTRSVLYQGALSEIFVPYMDPAEGWYQRTFFDGGEFGHTLGLARRPLERGTDCPDHASWFDMALANERGLPRRHQAVACLFERSGGEVAWRHRAGGDIVDSRPRRDLVLRWVATIGNYDYAFDWVFQTDGSIRAVLGATGIAEVKGVASRTAAEDKDGKDGAYGRFVAENIVAPNHDHFFSYRLDLDVDGAENSLQVDELEAKRLPETHPRKSLWVVAPRTARTESEAQLDRHAPALWRFVNPAVKGPLGYPTSYQIKAGHSDESLLAKDDYPQRRAGFTEHALWVTPYRPEELYAAGDYPTQSRGGDGLPAWTKANRPIEKTDIVAWYTFGMHHVVRAEDWPVMPTVYHEFELRPFDFFPRNPSLDLPKP
jgi:primary-amine oxidase